MKRFFYGFIIVFVLCMCGFAVACGDKGQNSEPVQARLEGVQDIHISAEEEDYDFLYLVLLFL